MKVAYIRVSTEEQNTARQEEAMKAYGVERVFIEKASGKSADRPQLKAMMDFIRSRIDGIRSMSDRIHGR